MRAACGWGRGAGVRGAHTCVRTGCTHRRVRRGSHPHACHVALSRAHSRPSLAQGQVEAPEAWGFGAEGAGGGVPSLRAFVKALDERLINAVQVRGVCGARAAAALNAGRRAGHGMG